MVVADAVTTQTLALMRPTLYLWTDIETGFPPRPCRQPSSIR